MSKSLRWGLLAVLLLFVFLLARFPAGLAVRLLPAELSLAGVEGSIWHGRASALGVRGIVAQEKLAWSLETPALLKGELAWRLNSEHAGQPGKLRAALGLRGASIEDLRLSLPLEPLAQFHPTLAGLRLRGDLLLESQRLARREPIRLNGRLERVSSAMASEVTALGSYQFVLSANAEGAGAMELSPLGGALQIQGGGSFELAANKFNLNLRLKPETDLPGLSPLLATLPREQDAYLLSYSR